MGLTVHPVIQFLLGKTSVFFLEKEPSFFLTLTDRETHFRKNAVNNMFEKPTEYRRLTHVGFSYVESEGRAMRCQGYRHAMPRRLEARAGGPA